MVAWLPILQQIGPSLIIEAYNHIDLSKKLVKGWLKEYMFAGDPEGEMKADELGEYLGNHNNFGAHSRRVGIEELSSRGAKVVSLATLPDLREVIESAYYALDITFQTTGAVKIFENHNGEAFIRNVHIGPQIRGLLTDGPPRQPALPEPPSLPQQQLSRQQKRAAERLANKKRK